jgi:hypothetical protein
MQMLRHGFTRRAGVFCLAALLLVPILLRGHHAGHTANSHACAVCVVAKHSPAVRAPLLAGIAPVFESVATLPAPPVHPARQGLPAATGRGPPLPPIARAV